MCGLGMRTQAIFSGDFAPDGIASLITGCGGEHSIDAVGLASAAAELLLISVSLSVLSSPATSIDGSSLMGPTCFRRRCLNRNKRRWLLLRDQGAALFARACADRVFLESIC